MTAGQLIEFLSRVPPDSDVQIDIEPSSWRRNPSPVSEVSAEQIIVDGPPTPISRTMVGTGVWVVTIR